MCVCVCMCVQVRATAVTSFEFQELTKELLKVEWVGKRKEREGTVH